jgi:cation:H+ antiporter
MVLLDLLLLLLGIALLAGGGEALIRGALGLAERTGLSPLLAGLVIVGFGTSMPELVVSLDALLGGHPDIAVGNVVGSNIANILLILGLCALVTPLAVTALGLWRDALTMIGATLLFLALAAAGPLDWHAGLALLALLAAYLGISYYTERKAPDSAAAVVHEAEAGMLERHPHVVAYSVGAVLLGLLLLIAGSRVVLAGAVGIAGSLGISEALIGLTLVAVGTSLPELTVSFIAALRRRAEVAVGNILGSNIFNVLGILGVSACLRPIAVEGRIASIDQWVMLGAAVALLVFLVIGRGLNRAEGAILLSCYVGYVGASAAGVLA